MNARGYTLLDVSVCNASYHSHSHPEITNPDDEVRRLEYIRQNLRSIIPNIPAACEFDLVASGHAHNPGRLMPLLVIYCPPEYDSELPDPFEMLETLEIWTQQITLDELIELSNSVSAPSWEDLLRDKVHPKR